MASLLGSVVKKANKLLQRGQGAFLYNYNQVRPRGNNFSKKDVEPKDFQWKPEGRPYLVSRWNLPKKKLHGFYTSSGSYKYKGVKKGDGTYVFPGDRLVSKQAKLNFHPGLNVTAVKHHMHLIALKEGVVRVTAEKPDLNWNHNWAKIFYAGMEGKTFFKKYFHVIPKPQHKRFKLVDQV